MLLLQHTEKGLLQRQGQLPDLIQKERPAVRLVDQPLHAPQPGEDLVHPTHGLVVQPLLAPPAQHAGIPIGTG